MRPKRPLRRPPAPPPPLPAVVTPEDLDAINTPDIDKLPAYISPGKFQWKPPVPGPKGDTGDTGAPGAPGEPGATVRPITPPVTNVEIAAAAVTPDKLNVTAPATDGQLYSYDATGKFKPVDPPTLSIPDDSIMPTKLAVTAPPTDGQLYSFDSASGKFKPVDAPSAGSLITLHSTPLPVHADFTDSSYNLDVNLSDRVPVTAKAVIVQMYVEAQTPTTSHALFAIWSVTNAGGERLAAIRLTPGEQYPIKDVQCVINLLTPQTMFISVARETGQTVLLSIRVVGYIE